MAKKSKDAIIDETNNVEHSVEIKASAEAQHSKATNPQDANFVNDGTSGAVNPHE